MTPHLKAISDARWPIAAFLRGRSAGARGETAQGPRQRACVWAERRRGARSRPSLPRRFPRRHNTVRPSWNRLANYASIHCIESSQ